MSSPTSSGKCRSPTRSSTVVRGCAPETTSGARSSSPLSSVTPVMRPPVTSIERTGGAGADRRAVRLGAPRERRADRAHSALDVAPCTRDAVQLAEVVVEQVVRGAGRPRAPPRRPPRLSMRYVPLMASVSNQSSRRSPTDIVITRNSSCTSRLRQPGGAAGLAQQPEQVARAAWTRARAAAGAAAGAGTRRRGTAPPRSRGRRRRPSASSARARPGCAPCRSRRGSACRPPRRWRTRGSSGIGLVAEVHAAAGRRRSSAGASRRHRRRATRAGRATAPR